MSCNLAPSICGSLSLAEWFLSVTVLDDFVLVESVFWGSLDGETRLDLALFLPDFLLEDFPEIGGLASNCGMPEDVFL